MHWLTEDYHNHDVHPLGHHFGGALGDNEEQKGEDELLGLQAAWNHIDFNVANDRVADAEQVHAQAAVQQAVQQAQHDLQQARYAYLHAWGVYPPRNWDTAHIRRMMDYEGGGVRRSIRDRNAPQRYGQG